MCVRCVLSVNVSTPNSLTPGFRIILGGTVPVFREVHHKAKADHLLCLRNRLAFVEILSSPSARKIGVPAHS